MELKPLMMELRTMLNQKKYSDALETVNTVLSTIQHGEDMEQERLGNQHWENPILDYDLVCKFMDDAKAQGEDFDFIEVHCDICDYPRSNAYGATLYIQAWKNVPPNATSCIHEAMMADMFPVAEEFQDWVEKNIRPKDNNDSVFTTSWLLVALFGTQPDPRLLNLVYGGTLQIRGLRFHTIEPLFNRHGWADFISNRYTMFQDSDAFAFDTDTN